MELTNNESFDFSQALLHLKDGHKVARTGWNGKNMYIVLQKGYPNGMAINKNTAEATGIPENTVCKFLPYIMMKTADEGNTFVPWLASQTDILGTDWGLITDGLTGVFEKEPEPIPEDSKELKGDDIPETDGTSSPAAPTTKSTLTLKHDQVDGKQGGGHDETIAGKLYKSVKNKKPL